MTVIFSSLYFIDSSLLSSRFLDVTQRSPQESVNANSHLNLVPRAFLLSGQKALELKVFRLHESFKRSRN